MKLLREIGEIFFRERMKEVESKRTQLNSIREVLEESKSIFEITIEYFCTIRSQEFLFETIFKNVQ